MKFFLYLCLVIALGSLAACTKHPASDAHDGAKRSIICFSPALTEIAFAIGAGNTVTGVSSFCNWPMAARSRVSVGGVANPNFEVMRTLNPNLIFLQSDMPEITQFCQKYDVSQHVLPIETFADITNAVYAVGAVTMKQENAQKVCNDIVTSWSQIRSKRVSPPVPAFICLWREDGAVAAASTISSDSFLADALACAGGSNICADVKGAYPTVSSEIVKVRQPRVIFEMRPGRFLSQQQHDRIVKEWQALYGEETNVNVVILTNDYIMIPGPRVTKTAELFFKTISIYN